MQVTVRIRRGLEPAAGWWRAAGRWSLWSALLGMGLLLLASFAARPRAGAVTPTVPAELAVTSRSLRQTGGLAVVEGRVKNLSGETLENVWVRAEFLDAQGRGLGWTEQTLLEPAKLEPFATAAFRLYGAPSRQVASSRLEFSHLIRRPLTARHETFEAAGPQKP